MPLSTFLTRPMPSSTFLKWLGHVSINQKILVEVGDVVDVKVIKIDDKGRIDASMKALLPKPEGYVEPEKRERSEKPRRHKRTQREKR